MAEQLSLLATIKNSGYIVAFITASHWIGINPQALFILFMLMVLDILTAWMRVGFNEGCNKITSNELERGIRAKFFTISAVFALALTAKGVGFEFETMSSGFVAIIMLSQLYSILGNAHSALTGKKKDEFDAIAYILNKVKTLIDKLTK